MLHAVAGSLRAQSAENVAVVINEASADSKRVGDYYVQKRSIPASNVIRLKTTAEEQIEIAAFSASIERPIMQALHREGLQDRILYLVLTKGVPLRINGTKGGNGTVASVDSELAVLYRRMTGRPVPLSGPTENPYFLNTRAIREAQPFTHRAHDIFLVTRLDGFTVDDVLALIDRAQKPATEGRVVLDQRSGFGEAAGDEWLGQAAARLRDLGHDSRVTLEDTGRAAGNVDNVLGYYSWGSNDPQIRGRQVGMRFVPGALASMFLSTDARTFKEPPGDWKPGNDTAEDKTTLFAGSSQSLAGDLIREGVTGVAANVAEPFLSGAVRPEILFPAYLAGFNLAESFYLALPNLSWQTVVIGDPLCAPFRKHVLTGGEIEEPADPATELPALFSKRRLEVARVVMKDTPPKAISLFLRAEVQVRRGDNEGARRSLEEATQIAPNSASIQLQLALMYEEASEWAKAMERFRQVLKVQPKSVIALNNLAYSLAVRQKAPEEARPLAQRAVSLAPNNPEIVDTLAWIEHLLGNDREAARLLRPVVQKGTGSADIRLHAAIVFAAIGEDRAADAQLKEALRLDPKLAEKDDVKTLRTRLGGTSPR
jgi:uncharacterized protein (TIGR03790 family)